MASANPKPAEAWNQNHHLSSGVEEGEGIARRCWIKSKKESTLALYTPFVISLASGNLNIENFRHYIAQDVHFLKAFAQAFELAEKCADEDDVKMAIGKLRKSVLEELKMHSSFVQEWGLDVVKESTINPATVKYIDFLLATASGNIGGTKSLGKLGIPFAKTKLAAYTLGAMTPCMSLYAYIGKELQALLDGKSNHPYKKWVENYSSEEIATRAAPKSDQIQPENEITRMASADLRNKCGLSKHYTEEYEWCIENILATEKAEIFYYKGLQKALGEISDFEKRDNLRVVESGVLKGLDLEDIKCAGKHLMLQDSCRSFFQSVLTNEKLDADIHVFSHCWCADLIRSAFSSGGLDGLKVHANEFMFEESLSTGEIIKKVESPADKLQVFNKIRNSCGKDKKTSSVFVGASVRDLLCLLEADIVILIGSISSSLKRVGDHFGLTFTPLFHALIDKQKKWIDKDSSPWKTQSGVLYTVSSWDEIHAFIIGT